MRSKLITALAAASALALAAAAGTAYAHRDGGGHGYKGHHKSYHGGGYHKGGWHRGKGWGRRGWRRAKAFADRYDANEDGRITQEEIDTNRTEWFNRFDTDGDGDLTLEEFQALWLEARRRRMVRMFQRLDEDGSAGITMEEYTDPMSRIVEMMDRNGDGVLSLEDRGGRFGKGRRGGGSTQMQMDEDVDEAGDTDGDDMQSQ